jgi:hypothetical protein
MMETSRCVKVGGKLLNFRVDWINFINTISVSCSIVVSNQSF